MKLLSLLMIGLLLLGREGERAEPEKNDFTKAKKAYTAAAKAKDKKAFDAALSTIIKDNSRRAVDFLVVGLPKLDDWHYWRTIEGLARIGSAAGVLAVRKAILRGGKKDTAEQRDMMLALQFNPTPYAFEALLEILKKGSLGLQVMAIDELVMRGKKQSVDALIAAVAKHARKKNEVWRQATKGLRALTKKAFGTTREWREWWKANKGNWSPPKPKTNGNTSRGTIAEKLRRNRWTDYEELRRGKKADIVVVKGKYDKVEKVLSSLGVPHRVIDRQDLETADWSQCTALFVNCDGTDGGTFKTVGKISEATVRKVRTFVAKGGYLYTSDCVVRDLLERAFPKYVTRNVIIDPEDDFVAEVEPPRGLGGHPLLRGIFSVANGGGRNTATDTDRLAIRHKWRLREDSFFVDVDPTKVTTLAEIVRLAPVTVLQPYKENTEVTHVPVVVTFRYGSNEESRKKWVRSGGVYQDLNQLKGGRVLHVLWHFSDQKAKKENVEQQYALQGVLINFLIEAKDARKLHRNP